MRTRIGTQLIVGAGLASALVIGLMTVLIMRSHAAQLMQERTRSANQLGETIQSSTHFDMLENRRDSLHRQIRTIGGLHGEGIRRVRLFNKDGRIMFSSEASETGTVVDTRAEACYACHAEGRPLERLDMQARARVFREGTGGRVLGIITPILNQASCSTADCHAHGSAQRVLGVLDVNVSLVEVDREIAHGRRLMVGLALLAIGASSAILWWLNRRLVLRPVDALLLGTRRVAGGDLSTAIPVTAKHELGQLATAFNGMMMRLEETRRQLTQADKLASVGRLAAGVAHEINNPLTGVLSYASLLRKRLTRDPGAQEDLEVIIRETKRCRGIILEMLDFARPTPPARRPTDLNEVVRHAVAVVMNQLELSQVALTLDLAGDLPSASLDANQIQQVVVNLLLNASDAIGPEGGGIRLTTRRVELGRRGHEVIRHATCPKGHDLLDPAIRIGGQPAIRVLVRTKGRALPIHLDPVYGSSGRLALEPLDEGLLAEYLCPVCGVSLLHPDHVCGTCGAPTLSVLAGEGDPVVWCARKGCHAMSWPSRDRLGDQSLVELVVADTGKGIPPEDLPHLFEPFFTTKGAKGTGLGLAVTWGIVESHGGTIEVESEVGQGTRFTLRIPLAPRPEDPILPDDPSKGVLP